jgi:hypothetical protein
MLPTVPERRTLFRIIATATPTLGDFLSDKAAGFPPRPQHPDLWDGVSMWNMRRQAERKALDLPFLGTHIAELSLDLAVVNVQRTLPGSRGHHTVWGEPIVLLSSVIDVKVVPS